MPSYEPCGSGDHLYLWIEKRGVAPEFFAQTIARKLNTSPGNVGTAGLKDRHAVTSQHVTIRNGPPRNLTHERLTLTLLYELRRRKKRWGVASACIGGGQGIAIVVESLAS